MSVSELEGWVCHGCGKHVTGPKPPHVCHDCGGEWGDVKQHPELLACDRCRNPDASRVLGNEDYNRLCWACIAWENRKEETPDEIAENYGQIFEFGQAIRLLESASAELRNNGHATLHAYECIEEAQDALDTVFNEYDLLRQAEREEDSQSRCVGTGSDS